jgi:tetratricopeptide (TPR) repeat protein
MAAWPSGLVPSRLRAHPEGITLLFLHPDGPWCEVEVTRDGTAAFADGRGFRTAPIARLESVLTARLGTADARAWIASATSAVVEERERETCLGARVLAAQRDLAASLEGLDLDAAAPDEPAPLACAAYLAALGGLPALAVERARRAAALARGATERNAIGRLLVALDDHRAALACFEAGEREGRVQWLDVGRAGAEVRDAARAEAALIRLGADRVARPRALGHLIAAGGFRAAQRFVAALLEPSAGELAQVAETHLFALELERAAALADLALSIDGAEPRALLVRAAIRVAGGRTEEGLRALEALEHGPFTSTVRLWMVRALIALGRPADAAEVARRPGYAERLAWKLWRCYAEALVVPERALRGSEAYQVRCVLEELAGRDETDRAYATDAGAIALLERTLARFGGNYSDAPTFLADRELALVGARSPRAQAERAQHLVVSPAGFAGAIAALDEQEERMPSSPFPRTYRAELLLWKGELEAARAEFEAIWEKTRTRWGYVGLGASLALLGRHAEALATWERAREHFTYLPREATWAYRGEVHLALGDLERAHADLVHATDAMPSRVGAWVALALVRARRGEPAGARHALDQALSRAPALVTEHARALGVHTRVSDGETIERLAGRALAALLGNRASSITTFLDASGRLRALRTLPNSHWHRLAAHLAPLARDALY